MSATSFNPLAVARDLKATGIEAAQAEAIAEGIRQAAGADHDALATKADLAALEVRMVKWAIGLAFAIAAVVLAGVRLMLGTVGG